MDVCGDGGAWHLAHISGVVLITQQRQISDKKWIKIYTVEE